MDQRALELLEHGMQDMYDAEHRFAQSLVKMARNAEDPSLKNGFGRHKEVTENQVKRLEQAFREMGRPAKREECAAAKGLVKEYEGFIAAHRPGNGFLDAFAANAGLKVEYYEIASYRALVNLAEFCGLDKVARLLSQNLSEEEQAAAEMMSASTKLGAKLAGASAAKVATRGVASMFDRARENTFSAIGDVKATAGTASDRVRSRARKAKAKPKPKARPAARKAKAAVKRKTARAKPKAKAATRKTARPTRRTTRKKPTARRTTTRTRSRSSR